MRTATYITQAFFKCQPPSYMAYWKKKKGTKFVSISDQYVEHFRTYMYMDDKYEYEFLRFV